MDALKQIREDLKANGSIQRPEEESELPVSGRTFRFLPDALNPVVKPAPSSYMLSKLPPSPPKKPEMPKAAPRIPCGILSDSATPHKFHGGVTKERAGRLVFLSHKATGQGIHLSGEFGEICSLSEIIFTEEFGTHKQRETTASTMAKPIEKDQKRLKTEYVSMLISWIKVRRLWEYEIALDMFCDKLPGVTWPASDEKVTIAFQEWAPRHDSKLGYGIHREVTKEMVQAVMDEFFIEEKHPTETSRKRQKEDTDPRTSLMNLRATLRKATQTNQEKDPSKPTVSERSASSTMVDKTSGSESPQRLNDVVVHSARPRRKAAPTQFLGEGDSFGFISIWTS